MEEFLQKYGLFALFVGAMIEGDVFLVLGGLVSHLGYFNPVAAVMAGALGNLAADCSWYALGRVQSRRLSGWRAFRTARGAVNRLIGRWGTWEIPVCRLVYGTRIASMFFWGARRLPFRTFAPMDALGVLAWAVLLGALGHSATHSVQFLMGEIEEVEKYVAGAVLAVAAVLILVHSYTRERMGRTAR
jgi:membrane protein DedA with SNARE-associated domain